MGAAGRRFGRNVPLEHVVPDTANLLIPNPRVVSRELMTRDAFQPATFLNLLAASWIQFMVHDWFVHKRSATDRDRDSDRRWRRLGRAGDHGPALGGRRRVRPGRRGRRRSPTRTATGGTGRRSTGPTRRPPRHSRPASAAGFASSRPGCCRSIPPPACTSRGFTDNSWIGLAMLHTLFTLEHNFIADLLAAQHPQWTDDADLREGQADHLGADGQDPHGRVDAGDPAAPGDPDGDAA